MDHIAPIPTVQKADNKFIIQVLIPGRSAPETAVLSADSPLIQPLEKISETINAKTWHPEKQAENTHREFQKSLYPEIMAESGKIAAKCAEQAEYWNINTAPMKEAHPAESAIVAHFASLDAGSRPEWIAKASASELSAVLRVPSLFDPEQLEFAREMIFRRRLEMDATVIVQSGKTPTAANPAAAGIDPEKLESVIDETIRQFRLNTRKTDDAELSLASVIRVVAALTDMQPDQVFQIIQALKK